MKTGTTTDLRPGWTSGGKNHFTDTDTNVLDHWIKNENGQLMLHHVGKKERQPAKSKAAVAASWLKNDPANDRPAELKVLERLVGTWDTVSIRKPAEWTPEGGRSTATVIRDDFSRQGSRSRGTIERHGHLPARIFGYAFALFAWVRGEHDPDWARHLRLDASATMKDGLRYLIETGDSLFDRDSARSGYNAHPIAELIERLTAKAASKRMAALWQLHELGAAAKSAAEPVRRCLIDRNEEVRAFAADTLASLGSTTEASLDALVEMLTDQGSGPRSAAAAVALGTLRSQPRTVVASLARLLHDADRNVVHSASWALHQFGEDAVPAATDVLEALKIALVDAA